MRAKLSAIVLAAIALTLPSEAGQNGWNHEIGYHSGPLGGGYFIRLHCERVGSSTVCGNATVDERSTDAPRAAFLGVKAAAAQTVCDPSTIAGSAFDLQAAATWPSIWSHPKMTPARKAEFCTGIDEWL